MVSLTFSKSIVNRLKENITKALKLNNIRLYRLAQALLWFSESMGTQEIARLIGVCERTIVNWLKTFMHKGIGWLVSWSALPRTWQERKINERPKEAIN